MLGKCRVVTRAMLTNLLALNDAPNWIHKLVLGELMHGLR